MVKRLDCKKHLLTILCSTFFFFTGYSQLHHRQSTPKTPGALSVDNGTRTTKISEKEKTFPNDTVGTGNVEPNIVFEFELWSGKPAQSNGITKPEEITPEGYIRNSSKATITVYSPNKKKNTGKAVLLCPGGAYSIIAAQHEGSDFARWFAENGITGIVLKYRIPNKHHTIPLDDAKEAMRTIRNHCEDWNIDPHGIGVMGFSAGGHLASSLLTHYDSLSRPDFGILVYPVVSCDPKITHSGSVTNLLAEQTEYWLNYYSGEKQVTANTPPTLLLHSANDTGVVPQNSIRFYEALQANKIQAALHIFPSGSHGWGFKPSFEYHELMKEIVMDWVMKK